MKANRRIWPVFFLMLIGLSFVFALASCVSTPPTTEKKEITDSSEISGQTPKTLALLPFENNSVSDPEKFAPLSKGLPAMLLTDLSRNKTGLQLIERHKIQALLKEIVLSQSGSVDDSTAVKVGKIVGAQAITFGSFMVLGDVVRIDTRIVKVETSEVILAESVLGDANDFIGLEQQLAGKIASSLKVALAPKKASSGSSIEAALMFSKGVEAFDNGRQEEAEQFFKKSIEADSSYETQVDSIKNSK